MNNATAPTARQKNVDAQIARLYRGALRGSDRRLAKIGHDVVLIVADEDGNDHLVGDTVFYPDDWRHMSGPPAVIDAETGLAGFLGSYGRPYRYAKVRYARCASEAEAFIRAWKRSGADA